MKTFLLHKVRTTAGILLLTILLGLPQIVRTDDFDDLGTIKGKPAKAKPKKPPVFPKPSKQKTKPGVTGVRKNSGTSVRNGRATGQTGKPATPARAAAVNLTGTWLTTDGWTVKLKQQGSRCTGSYSGDFVSGTLSGTVSGNAFNGTFSHKQGAIAFKGKMYLAASGNKLNGRWSAGDYSEPIVAIKEGTVAAESQDYPFDDTGQLEYHERVTR